MTRFSFGDNWTQFIGKLRPEQIDEAEKSIRSLLNRDTLAGTTFLDIGSGSGLFSLAAANLGADVTSFDFDAASVTATQALRDVSEHSSWRISQGSILDQTLVQSLGQFDVVYSWGVLHHTGAMWSALENAASLVKPNGTLAISLYRRTPMCSFWTIEKRMYASAPSQVQTIIRGAYKTAYMGKLIATGKNPLSYVREYKKNRGMEWTTNVHDWLGGYPYESTTPTEVKQRLSAIGFNVTRSSDLRPWLGLLGTGCDEYVAVRA